MQGPHYSLSICRSTNHPPPKIFLLTFEWSSSRMPQILLASSALKVRGCVCVCDCMVWHVCMYHAASGEPPLCMSCSLLFAVKRAIESAREDAGNNDVFPLGDWLLVWDVLVMSVFLQWGQLQWTLFRRPVWSTQASSLSKLLDCCLYCVEPIIFFSCIDKVY